MQTADGKRVGVDKLAADSAQRKIILQAQDDGYGAQVANAMLDGYDGKTAPESYYEAYRDAMTAAWEGESLQDVLHDAGTALPAKSVKAAWETGREIAARDAIRERIGPAGRQQLDQLAPEQTEVFEKYYKAGLEGKSFDQARKEIGQADASLNSTLRAAVRAGARDAQGGFTYGRQNPGNGQERQGSVDSGERGARVAEGAEHEQSGAGAAEERSSGEAAGQDTGAAQVSTKALGVPEGTDRAAARVIPAEEQTPAQRAKVAEYAKAGAELVLIEGNLEIQGETGTMHARGARIGDRIIASVNDEGATWEQIARHEAKHRYFEQHPDAVQQEWERVTGYMDADSIEEWLAYYAGKYAALGDIVDIAYIQEEALCDLAAEIETGKATERDYRALETVKTRTEDRRMGMTGRYSIIDIQGENDNYGSGVLLDTNIFDGVKRNHWGAVLGNFVYQNLAGKELTLHDENGNTETVYLARESDRVRKDGAKSSHKVIDKLTGYRGNETRAKAIVQLDEVLATSKHKETTDEHSHQWLDENGWETRTTYLQDSNGNIYEVTVNIADGRRGRILYDVSRVHRIDKKSGSGKHTATGESQRSRYQEPGTGRTQSEATKNSVAEKTRSVKTRFAIADVAETRGGRPTSDQAKFSVSEEELPDIIQKGSGIRWDNGKTLRLGKREYAAVTSRISTRYYYTNTRHEGVQLIDRTTDGKNAQHYMYLYLDHGFGAYQIVGRLTYGMNDELIHTLREEIANDRSAERISESTERVRAIHDSIDGRGDVREVKERYQGDERENPRSGGRRAGSDGRANWTDSVRHDGRSESGNDRRGTGRGVKPKFSLSSEVAAEDRQTLQEYEVQTALWDAMDHADQGNDNVIKLGRMPRYVRTLTGIDGDFYIYRNHAYENMATREQAERDGRPTRRGRQDIHFHGLGIDTMTEAILSTEDPLVTIWEKSKDGNPVISMVLPVKDADGAPLYAVLGFYTRNRINGQMKVRPHVLLTISNRALFGEGRRGTVEAINDAIAEKRILGMADIKKVRANLTLTSQHTKLTGITVNALNQNVAQFQREVKQFRAKNKINYSAASTQADGAIKQNDATEQDTAADWTAESRDLARELEDAQKRNKALEAVNRKLREQMKVTPPDTADQRELRGAAKRLAENYGGGLRQKDLTKQLQSIWRLRAEAQRGSEENRREKRGQMNEELEQLAAELTRNYLDKDNPEAETLREIRRIVRTTKIQLTPELRGDLDREGGYRDFRQRNWGRMRLANSGLGVDQLYQELSEQWPAYFPEGIWNPADQLMQIADVIQDGTTILARSPYGDQDGMQYMKTKILWELGAVPAAQPTLADQAAQGAYREEALRRGGPGAGKEQLIDAAAAHEQEQMDQLDAWYREHLRKVKADREDQIQKVKDRYQERAQAERDRKAEQELKRRLLWHGNRLKRMGRTATPAQQAEIGKIIGEINLACQNMTKTTVVRDYIQGMSTESIPADGYRDKADPRRTMSAEEAAQNPEMRGDKVVDVSELKAWYEEQKKSNPDFIADRRVEEILANMDKKQIGEMTPREVQQLLDVALNIENEIRTQKKLIDTADRREVYQQVLEVIGDIESTRGRGDRNLPKVIGAVKDGGRWLVDGTLTPVRLLRRFTGYQDNDPLYRAALDLQQGELKQLDYQRRAYARFEDFAKDRKFMDYLAGKGKQKPIEITGMNERGEQVTCRITPDMRVALYLHSKNYQNLRHIQRGGIEVPDYAAYVAGRYTDAYDKATRIRLAPGTVRAIGETMTTREKNYAEAIRNYYNTMSKAEINAVSVKLKGYEVAKVGEYYPIALLS